MAGALAPMLLGKLFKGGSGAGMQGGAAGPAPEAPRNFDFNNMMNPQQRGMLPTPPMGGGMGNSMGGGMGGMLKNRLFGG